MPLWAAEGRPPENGSAFPSKVRESSLAKALDDDEMDTLDNTDGGVIKGLGVPPATVAAVACHVQGGKAAGYLAEGDEPWGHVRHPGMTA